MTSRSENTQDKNKIDVFNEVYSIYRDDVLTAEENATDNKNNKIENYENYFAKCIAFCYLFKFWGMMKQSLDKKTKTRRDLDEAILKGINNGRSGWLETGRSTLEKYHVNFEETEKLKFLNSLSPNNSTTEKEKIGRQICIGVLGSLIAAIIVACAPKLNIFLNKRGIIQALEEEGYKVEKVHDPLNDTISNTLSYFDAKSYNEKIAVSFGENDD